MATRYRNGRWCSVAVWQPDLEILSPIASELYSLRTMARNKSADLPTPNPDPCDLALDSYVDDFERQSAQVVASLGPSLDLDTFSAAFNLFRVSARFLHDLEIEVHRPLGLSIAGFRVLFTVWVFDELEPRQIAVLSGVTRAAVSGVLNTLERDGLAERSRDQSDRRLVTVRLTEDGLQRVMEAYGSQNQREATHFDVLSADELGVFSRIMRKLLAAPLDKQAE